MKKLKQLILITIVQAMLLTPIFAQEVEVQIINPTEEQTYINSIKSMLDIMEHYYYKDIDSDKLLESTLKGMLSGLDPYSEFMTGEEYKDWEMSVTGGLTGIGVKTQKKDEEVLIFSVISDSPAEKAGIKAGDSIVEINGENTAKMTLNEAVKKIRGEEGTKVTLGVKKEGTSKIEKIELTRTQIKENPITYEIKDGIAYIAISQFNSYTEENLKPVLEKVKNAGLNKIVLDLRNNPGGLLDEVIDVANLLIPKGPILHTKGNDGTVTYNSELEKPQFKIICLVNGETASAAEILASAIKDSGVGVLVGEQTYGKGVVQSTIGLNTGDFIKITTHEYFTRNEHKLNGIGVQPNYIIENADEQLKKAKLLAK